LFRFGTLGEVRALEYRKCILTIPHLIDRRKPRIILRTARSVISFTLYAALTSVSVTSFSPVIRKRNSEATHSRHRNSCRKVPS
jgi:hypothetical protein